MAFYAPRNIGPADQVLFDADGNAVGIQPAASSSPPVLGFNPGKHAAIDSLVSEDGIGNGHKSVLTIGGDHPYAQWWGSNGNDGMAAMYLDAGIRPYIAICADETTEGATTSGYGATLNKPGMMTTAQAQALQARGCEFISHGTRHTHFWELFNTGIRVYYTGGEATPTVNISTTQLTTSTATTGATAFTWSSYPTLAQLAAAINALAGWNCVLASELTGSEPSAAMVPLRAARSVTDPGGSDGTKSNQRFALSAGIMVRYTGTAYRDVSVSVNNGSNFFGVYADGARLIATTTAAPLSTIVAAINALNVAGLTALVMDNGFAAQSVAGSTALNPGQKIRETYCYGDEDGTALTRINLTRTVSGRALYVTAGMGLDYTIRRSILAVKERAASTYGLTIDSFAQPGGRLWPDGVPGILDAHVSWRGNRSRTEQNSSLSPHAMPANSPGKFTGHFTSIVASSPGTPYSEADVKAVIDAMGDGDGWHVNWLNHLVTPTPLDPSPYTGLDQQSAGTYTSSADQDEGPFYRELRYAATARDAGLIDILPPAKAERLRVRKRGPSNLVFNPRFRNGRSNNLAGITTAAGGAGGIACPGWSLATAAGDYSAVTVDPATGALTLTTNGALGANRVPIGCNVFLEPGKTYDIGCELDLVAWGAANNARLTLRPLNNSLGRQFQQAAQSFALEMFYGGAYHGARTRFSVPAMQGAQPARVVSVAGPFSFTAGDSITLRIDNRTASAAIVLTGLTSAAAVANAINTALAADATYGPLGQYHRAARVEDGRLVIEAPNAFAMEDAGLMELLNSVGTPMAVLFGAGVTVARSTPKPAADATTSLVGYRLDLSLSTTSATQTLRVIAPYCREVLL